MNVALILAGGYGKRMNSKSLPKQFLKLYGKPILIYTLEHFENCSLIDAIVIVCVEGWVDYCRRLLDFYQIKKAVYVVKGGDCGQSSIFNGLDVIHEHFPEDTIVLIHDGVRPMIDQDLIERNIECVKKNGNAVSVSPATETVMLMGKDGEDKDVILPRDECFMAKAPQGFFLKDIYAAHLHAISQNFHEAVDSASLMQKYGQKLHTVYTDALNVKITVPSDYYVFRALINAEENSQIFGY